MLLKCSVLFIVFYAVVTVLQFFAGVDGLSHLLGLQGIFVGLASALLAFIPAIGPAVGLYGAVVVWKWPIIGALLLFFWPYFILAGLMLIGSTQTFLIWKKAIWPFARTAGHPDDIEPEFTVKEKASTDNAEAFQIEYKPDESGR